MCGQGSEAGEIEIRRIGAVRTDARRFSQRIHAPILVLNRSVISNKQHDLFISVNASVLFSIKFVIAFMHAQTFLRLNLKFANQMILCILNA